MGANMSLWTTSGDEIASGQRSYSSLLTRFESIEYIDIHNEDPTPFVWTKTADQLLESIARYAQRTTVAHAA